MKYFIVYKHTFYCNYCFLKVYIGLRVIIGLFFYELGKTTSYRLI